MKKSIDYAPYLFALIMPRFSALTNNLLFKPGVVLNWITLSLILFGLWRLNERLLSISNNLFVKWGSLFLGSSLYILSVIGLNYYVLHILSSFSGLSPLNFSLWFFSVTLISTFAIEGIKLTKAGEQSKIENLTLLCILLRGSPILTSG